MYECIFVAVRAWCCCIPTQATRRDTEVYVLQKNQNFTASKMMKHHTSYYMDDHNHLMTVLIVVISSSIKYYKHNTEQYIIPIVSSDAFGLAVSAVKYASHATTEQVSLYGRRKREVHNLGVRDDGCHSKNCGFIYDATHRPLIRRTPLHYSQLPIYLKQYSIPSPPLQTMHFMHLQITQTKMPHSLFILTF